MNPLRFRAQGLIPMNLNWWQPTRRDWVPVLQEDHPQFWAREVDPTYQRPWASLSPRYAAWKDKHFPGEPILRATGEMQDSAKIFYRKGQFLVRSTRYGKFHQFGTSRMTARPWMGVPDISLKQIVPIAWRNILSRKR